MKKYNFLYIFIFLFFVACAAPPVLKIDTPFSEEELKIYSNKGSGKIHGQAFLKTRGGDVKYGAGNTIYLIPSTPYTDELMNKVMIRGGGLLHNMDQRLSSYIKTTIADGEGKFDFINLPKGDYYVGCQISWQYARKYGLATTGANIYEKVNLNDGQDLKVILTK